MKILFVSSGNAKNGISPIIQKQGDSVNSIVQEVELDFFSVKGKGLTSYFKAILSLKKELQIKKYDIIHAHYSLCGYVALLAHKSEKLIISFMGDDLLGVNKQDGTITLSSRIMAYLNKWVAKLFFNAVIVKSDEMLRKFGKGKNVFLVPNGVDVGMFKPINKQMAQNVVSFNPQNKNIIFVSNPSRPEKNFSLARDAVALLNDNSIVLHSIFDIPIENLPYYYNAADMLLMTSFHEGSPNVIKEAMACNCPIVCTEVGDVKELFGNTPGCYISGFTPYEVKDKIMTAINFRQQSNYTLGRNRITEMQLDSTSIAKKILKIYTEIN